MGNFVPQYTGQLGFALCRFDQSGVHADKTTRQRECIQGGILEDKKPECAAVFAARCHQAITQIVQILGQLRIVVILWIGVDVAHDLAAQACFFSRCKRGLRHLAQIRQFAGSHRLCT